jgi:CBS domain-containing protein
LQVNVVDEENRAIGVITLSDVLRALLPPQSPDDRPTQAELAAAATGGAIGDLATQAHQQPPKPVFTSRRGSTGASPTASPTARRTRGVEANNRKRKGSIPSLQLVDEDDGEVLATEPAITPAQAAPGDAAAELHEDKKRRVEE